MRQLATLPAGVTEGIGLAERFDECLRQGFARLGSERQALGELAAVMAATPLGPPVADAVEAVGRGELVPRHFLALAAARAALLGAVHDALVAQARGALGRPSATVEPAPLRSIPGSAALLASTQQWLTELATAGFHHLEETSVAPFQATVERLQEAPGLTGLAALATGFVNELLRKMPARRQPALPVFRWADLWSAIMVRTQGLPAPPTFREVEGTLTPLGLDVQSHDNFVCALLYGVLETDGRAQAVRLSLSSWKVDVIAGPEIWDLFGPTADPVLAALAGHRTLQVEHAELWAGGDLVLRSEPTPGGAADPFGAADRTLDLPPPPPLLRHPVLIAEPVRLPADHGLPLAAERMAGGGELTEKVLAGASELVGLLRFDQGGWRVQPLCAGTKKGWVMSGEGLAQARGKLKNPSLATLRERAGRLLRES